MEKFQTLATKTLLFKKKSLGIIYKSQDSYFSHRSCYHPGLYRIHTFFQNRNIQKRCLLVFRFVYKITDIFFYKIDHLCFDISVVNSLLKVVTTVGLFISKKTFNHFWRQQKSASLKTKLKLLICPKCIS